MELRSKGVNRQSKDGSHCCLPKIPSYFLLDEMFYSKNIYLLGDNTCKCTVRIQMKFGYKGSFMEKVMEP